MSLMPFTLKRSSEMRDSTRDSFSSDDSDDLERILEQAEEAAANNKAKVKRQSLTDANLRTMDLDCVVDSLYEGMEEAAMLDILAEIESECLREVEYAPVASSKTYGSSTDVFNWNVVATPAMMMQFGAMVANAPVPVQG